MRATTKARDLSPAEFEHECRCALLGLRTEKRLRELEREKERRELATFREEEGSNA